jgi:predicted RNA-binding Zn ribbon-like protein
MKPADAATRSLLGGSVCLDFANSVDWSSDGAERPSHADALTAPEDLVTLARRLGTTTARAPLAVSGRDLRAALAVRRAVHEIFASISAGSEPETTALASLHEVYREAIDQSQLVARDGRWELEWPAEDQRRIVFAVAVDAIELLRDPGRLERVRMCPGNNCGWLFIDTSGRRRWCSMEVCGSRAKMRRLYERQRMMRSEISPARLPRTRESSGET